VSSMSSLGWCYETGSGVDADRHAAIDLYRRAAEADHVGASFNLGVCYENGTGVARDLRKARRWYERAAAAGDSDATVALTQLDALEAQ